MPSLTEHPPLSHQGDIIIVDDSRANLKLLEGLLSRQGYETRSFEQGSLALAAAIMNPPDLILLDVNMPEMDGYEVCERLKSIEKLSGVPVIFLSALNQTQDKVKAFQCGAADYVSKPFRLEEFRARIETHLKLHRLQQASNLHSKLLEDAVAARTRELAEANEPKRKEAESRLRLLTERLSLATAVANVGVWDWDLTTNLLTWDATMFRIYGFSPIVPMPYDKWATAVLTEDLPEVEAILQRVIGEKSEGSAEFRIMRPDGDVRNISAVERVVLNEHGTVSRVVGVNLDVTERRAVEHSLEKSRGEQLRFKDEFLSHVSHELRSPLTAIKQFTSILLGGVPGALNKEQRDLQEIVLKNIGQLQSMIDDLLEVTRLETGKMTVEPARVFLSNVVMDAFNTMELTAAAKKVALSCDLMTGLPPAHADETRLRQVLIILLDNAIKFTPAGGAVRLAARLLPEDTQFLVLEVSDTGCGIGPEIAERIFERHYQVAESTHISRKGLGLGLYISKNLVTRQGGRIWVESRPQEGSTFLFTVPVFSLDSLIAPLLRDGKWPADSVALIRVRVSLLKPWLSKDSEEEWFREARTLLQRCLLPDLDVLLPDITSGPQNELLFVAAFADDKGAAALTKRVCQQFGRFLDKQTHLAVSVSYGMLKPLLQDRSAPIKNIVASMAKHLEDAIEYQDTTEAGNG